MATDTKLTDARIKYSVLNTLLSAVREEIDLQGIHHVELREQPESPKYGNKLTQSLSQSYQGENLVTHFQLHKRKTRT